MKKAIQSFLIASSIALSIPAAFACDHDHKEGVKGCPMMEHGGRGFSMDHMAPPFLHFMKLNDSQQDAVFDILHQSAPDMRNFAKEAHKTHEELRALTATHNYNDAEADKLIDRHSEAMAKLMKLRNQTEHKIYSLLTPEQQRKVDERTGKHEGCMAGEGQQMHQNHMRDRMAMPNTLGNEMAKQISENNAASFNRGTSMGSSSSASKQKGAGR